MFLSEWRPIPVWKDPPPEPLLIRGQVHIWYWDFHHIRDFEQYIAWISSDERARLTRFKTEESKRNFLGSHIFLRRVLSLYLNTYPSSIAFESVTQGKPQVAEPVLKDKLEFNLSHCHQRVLCAVARVTQVGIDIERVVADLYDERTAKLVFSEVELAVLRGLEPADRSEAFIRGWTRKEAYAKCLGGGISDNLKDVELSLTLFASSSSGVDVRTFYCPDGYIGSVAATSSASEYFFFKWK